MPKGDGEVRITNPDVILSEAKDLALLTFPKIHLIHSVNSASLWFSFFFSYR
jgi:hypothetical protein